MIKYKRCGYNAGGGESQIELHHKIPKSIGGTDTDGRVYLCKKCHNIWHNMLPKNIFKYLTKEKKEEIKQHIKQHLECG